MQKDRVQILNPRTGHWVKINTKIGGIIGHKWDGIPYQDVQTVEERESSLEYKEQLVIDNIINTHHFKIDPKYAKRKIKCDCGHFAKSHFQTEGCCTECGCTWYSPNYHWIQKQQIKQAKEILNSKESKK
jgi:hypothetical protein